MGSFIRWFLAAKFKMGFSFIKAARFARDAVQVRKDLSRRLKELLEEEDRRRGWRGKIPTDDTAIPIVKALMEKAIHEIGGGSIQ